MKTEFAYQNYSGPESSLLFVCDRAGRDRAASLANRIVRDGGRVIFDLVGAKESEGGFCTPETAAQAIETGGRPVFFLTGAAVSQLEFRNRINFALSLKKKPLCLKMEEFELEQGLDMQLANAQVENWTSETEAMELLTKEELFTQEILGGGQLPRKADRKKKLLVLLGLLLLVLGTGLGAAKIVQDRIAYFRSPAYVLRNADGQEYLDASVYKEEGLEALAGKNIGELDLTDAGLTDISALENVQVRILDLAGNPGIHDMYPLLKVKGLEEVRVSQDMLNYIYMVKDCGFEIVVER